MDLVESTGVVFHRIKLFEPESVVRQIIGYLLMGDNPEGDMIRLAFCPESSLLSVVQDVKNKLELINQSPASSPSISPSMNPNSEFLVSSASSCPASHPGTFRFPSSSLNQEISSNNQTVSNLDFTQLGSSDNILEDYLKRMPIQYLLSDDEPEEFSFPGSSRRSPASSLEVPTKPCYYFNKGFCKHGSNCRYSHGGLCQESSVFSPVSSSENFNDDHTFLSGALEKLELEMIELLKSRKGNPVSIASLPLMYYEKYGKTLQAEGYLTERQRQGKPGYSLTKLLALLGKSIKLIDRPHGQHSIVLAEDAVQFTEEKMTRSDLGPIASEAQQIYLTFPVESTFVEEDVANYFNNFGPVEDVRIPQQEKRMFGFVSFESSETAKMILRRGNPHFICGARVLVKPYRERSKPSVRKNSGETTSSICCSSHCANLNSELHYVTREFEISKLISTKPVTEQEQNIEVQIRHLAKLMQKSSLYRHHFVRSRDELKFTECFNSSFDVLRNGSTSVDRPSPANNGQESIQVFELPEIPFASPTRSGSSESP